MRLRRPCIDCEEIFQPRGRASKLCDDCLEIRHNQTIIKLRERRCKN